MADKNNSANSSFDVHQNGSKEVKIDILDEDWWEPMPGCCIYKVPIDLRKKNEEAYTPQVISIGPLHYGKNELRDMQKQKKRYKHMFKERKGDEKLEEMKRYIKSQEINIRNCYEQPSLLEQYQFVGMILDDTVFIIELFLRHYWNVDDFLLEKPRYKNTVKRDLQLLENQLPYFVLNELYMSSIKGFDYSTTGPPSFLDISCKFFDYKSYADLSKMEGFNVKHFTDLRRYVLMQNHPTSITPKKVVDLPCATKLDKSGVSCKHVEYEDQLLHLKFLTNKRGSILPFFKKYELQIPRIIVNDWTEVLMMALVQCHYPKETHVCNYIAFLDFLINTEKDADLLIEKGIIVNCLGENKAIARTFNNFCLQISRSPSCYSDLAERLKAHYRSPYHHAKATLKSVYFGDPWKGTGTVVGILILLLALANTVHTILRFYVKY